MGMGSAKKGGTKAEPYINVTPLIDVLLVLLIIFMVITPLKPSRFQADIPTQRDPNEDLSQLKPNPLTLVVSISNDLQLKLNQDAMGSVNDTAILSQKLRQVFQQRKEQRAYKTRYGKLELKFLRKSASKRPSLSSAPRNAIRRCCESNRCYQRRGANPVGLQVDDLPQ
jgi:biopolymer transport protein ExbD